MNTAFLKRIALILTVTQTLLNSSYAAQNHSKYSASSIEALMSEYYAEVNHEEGTLDESDLTEYAVDVMDEVLLLPTRTYNDVILHAMADYRQNPSHRSAIEKLFKSIEVERTTDPGADSVRAEARAEFFRKSDSDFAQTVFDDAVVLFSAAYTFQFGHGAWNGMRAESKGLLRFKDVVNSVSQKLIEGEKTRKKVFLMGGVAGLAHATYESLSVRRENPLRLLSRVQAECAHSTAQRMLTTGSPDERDRLKAELQQLLASAPELQGPYSRFLH